MLKRHNETIAADSPPIRLLSPAGAPEAYFIQLGWQGGPARDAEWRASGGVLTPAHPVTLETTTPTGGRFRLELSVDGDYLFTVRQDRRQCGHDAGSGHTLCAGQSHGTRSREGRRQHAYRADVGA